MTREETQNERSAFIAAATEPHGVVEVSAEVTSALASEINALRTALAMRNSDVQELIRVLAATLKFYDAPYADHLPGAGKILDEIATAIADYSPPRIGCGDPSCVDPNCDYGA